MKRGLTVQAGVVAAFLALTLLGFASVRSIVMQAVAAAPASPAAQSPCADMAGMNAPAKGSAPAGKVSKACVYCAAAAHLPVCATAVTVAASTAVEWAAYGLGHATGPLGPIPFAPKARGPPQLSPTT